MFVLVASLLLPLVTALPANYLYNLSMTYDGSQLTDLNQIDSLQGVDPQMASSLKQAINAALPDYLAHLSGSNATTTMSPEVAAFFNQPNLTNFLVNINTASPGQATAAPAASVSESPTVTPALVDGVTLHPPTLAVTMPASTIYPGKPAVTPAQDPAVTLGGTGGATTLVPEGSTVPGMVTVDAAPTATTPNFTGTTVATTLMAGTTTMAPTPNVTTTVASTAQSYVSTTLSGDTAGTTTMATTSFPESTTVFGSTAGAETTTVGTTTMAPLPTGPAVSTTVATTTAADTTTMGH